MVPLVVAILLASLLGSLHCVGMCGAFIAIATNDSGSPQRHGACQCAYHLGRLVSYVALGIAAGFAGKLLNIGGALAGLRSAAAILAGGTIIAFAVLTLCRHFGLHLRRSERPTWLSNITARVYRFAMSRSPLWRATLIGLSTTLLPCGWLYAFVATAAGTASWKTATAVMFFFWLGTLPLLVSFGAGVQTLFGPLQKRLPVATCGLLLVAGGYTLFGRTQLDPLALGAKLEHQIGIPQAGQTPPCCAHDADRH